MGGIMLGPIVRLSQFSYLFLFLQLAFIAGCLPSKQPVINSFTASPAEIDAGETSQLVWATTAALAVSIAPDVGSVTVDGETTVHPLETTTYILTASNGETDPAKLKQVTKSITVVVRPLLSVNPKATPSTGAAPLTVKFSPGVGTQTAINFYYWDMNGDGVDDRSDTVGHDQPWTYTAPGTYNVRLSVTDSEGRQDSGTIVVTVTNAPPTVSVTTNVTNGVAPLTATLTATAIDNEGIASYEWDFNGDGVFDQTSTTGSVQHLYSSPGTYKARVRVTDNLGVSTTVDAPNIEIRVVPVGDPTVSTSLNRVSGNTPLAVSFSASATVPSGTSITSWAWDFDGDGVTDSTTASSASYTYTSPGIFYPALVVTYSNGKTAKDVKMVTATSTRTLSVIGNTISPALSQTATINVGLGGAERTRLVIENAAGQIVKTLLPWAQRAAGSLQANWDGKNDAGQSLPGGSYYAILEYGAESNVQRLDLRLATGGAQYNPTRTAIPSSFAPYDNRPLVISFTLTKPSEVTAFMGLFNTNTRLRTFMNREALGTGTYSIVWNGDSADGQPIPPVINDPFLFGIWGYYLADNVIYLKSNPDVSAMSVLPAILNPAAKTAESDGKSHIKFILSATSNVEVVVSDADAGAEVRNFVVSNVASGNAEVAWDGKNNAGEYVAPGRYRVGLRAIDALGNRSMLLYGMTRVYY